jgi:hypothetical protein
MCNDVGKFCVSNSIFNFFGYRNNANKITAKVFKQEHNEQEVLYYVFVGNNRTRVVLLLFT